jgi:hypothetical protein
VPAGGSAHRAKGWLAFAKVWVRSLQYLASGRILAGKVIDVAPAHWDGLTQLAFHVDGLVFSSQPWGGIGNLSSSCGCVHEEEGYNPLYCLVLIFRACLINLVYTADLFLLYMSWELVGLCSFLLVASGTKSDSAYGARKVFTITHLAGTVCSRQSFSCS